MKDAFDASLSLNVAAYRWFPRALWRRVTGTAALGFLMASLLGVMSASWALLGMVVSALAYSVGRFLQRPSPAVATLDAGNLIVTAPSGETRGTWPLSTLAAGWIETLPEGERRVVLSFDNSDSVELSVGSLEKAQTLLRHLGVGATQRALSMRTGDGWRRFGALLGGLGVGFATLGLAVGAMVTLFTSPIAAVLMLIPLALLLYLMASLLQPSDVVEVVIGADGVSIRGELSEQYVSLTEVARVETEDRVSLVRHDGTKVEVLPRRVAGWRRKAVATRLEEVLAAHRARVSNRMTEELLGRSGKPYAEWAASLRTLGRVDATYRAAAIQTSDLVEVMEDPSAAAPTRVAAALSLTEEDGAMSESNRTRVRIVADASADDALRLALSQVMTGDFDERSLLRLERVVAQRGRR